MSVLDYTTFTLPPQLVTKADVARMVAEVERADNHLTTAAAQKKVGGVSIEELVLSETLMDFLQQNKLTLDDGKQRSELIRQLRKLKDGAPVIHMTFATPADQESLQQIVAWLRSSIHAQAVVLAGLQPALVAGVYVRTTNHVHDLSLRRMVQAQRSALVEQIGALRG